MLNSGNFSTKSRLGCFRKKIKMASDSDEDDHKGEGYIRCLQISVVIYGIVNLIIRGVELALVIISTSVIIAAYVAGINHPHPTFHDYLSEEARHSIWRGPYPNLMIHQNNVTIMAQNITPFGMVAAPNVSLEMLSVPNVTGNLSAPNVTGKLSAPNVTGTLSAPDVSGTLSVSAPVGVQSAPNVSGTLSANVSGTLSAPVGVLSAPKISVGMLSEPIPNALVNVIPAAPDMPVGTLISAIDGIQEKINIYIWSTNFLMKIINVAFSFLLVCSAKKFSFSGNLAWVSFSIPILAQQLLQFIMDLSFGDYFLRELPSQIWQGVDIGYQLLGIVTVSIFLHLLYHMDDKIRGIDRYNGFPSSRINGDISITEIIENEDDQRFK